jgi:hypothetical protein
MTNKQKRKKAIIEDEYIKNTPQPFKFVLILLRYYTKEMLALLVIILLGLFIIFNVSWDSENGLRIAPTIKAEIKKEI